MWGLCLGVPCRVVEVCPGDCWAVVENFGVRCRVGVHLVGEVGLGDYLMVHAGYAIEKLDLAEARERLRLWEELLDGGTG